MEAQELNIVKIIIAGKNVTADITPYLSRLAYADKVEMESDDVTLVFEDTAGHWQNGWYPDQGDSLTMTIGTPTQSLDCGLFEIDQIEFEGPPDTVTVKGIAAPINKTLRTKNSKAFEKQSLYQIAQYFANKHGLTLTGNVSELQKIEIERKTQERQTDLSFLAGLAKEFGILFSVRGDQLVFFDVEELEKKPVVLTLKKTDLSTYQFTDKTSQVYGGATVSSRNMKTNSVRRWNVEPAEKDGDKGRLTNEVLQENTTAENDTQAQAKAKAGLKDKNKDKITGTITMPGNVKLVAGVNIHLEGFGKFSGKWHVVSSAHDQDKTDGYKTAASLRKVQE